MSNNLMANVTAKVDKIDFSSNVSHKERIIYNVLSHAIHTVPEYTKVWRNV